MTVAHRGRPALLVMAMALAGCAPPATSSEAPSGPTTSSGPPTWPTTRTRATTPTTVTTTPTAGPGSRGLAGTDRLEQQHRLAQALPHSTPHYRIDFAVGADGRLRLVVTLLAELNSSQDLAGYQAQLRRYKAEALEFIRGRADDPASYSVAYLPPEAAAL